MANKFTKITKENCLATTHPELAKEWHPTKNGDLTPNMILPGSNKKVWWKCPKGDDHEWESKIGNRRYLNQECSICTGRKTVLSNCLATTHPELAKEWHPTKNGDLTPYDVGFGNSKKVWWKCSKGDDHEWESTINNRSNKNTNCSICANKTIVLSNCLATTNPKLAKEWHPTKNDKLTPINVHQGSHKKVWWKCSKGDDHEWESTIGNRFHHNKNCSVCAGKKIVLSNCLATLAPNLLKEWHPTKNGNLTPFDISPGTHKKVWWKCPKGDDHEWEASPDNRFRSESNCSICNPGGFNPKLKGYLYLHKISINNKEAIKVGITNNRDKRIKSYQREKLNYKMKNITHFYGNGKIVQECEKFIKKKYSTSYLSKKEMPEGYTETIKYDKNNLKDIIQHCIERI